MFKKTILFLSAVLALGVAFMGCKREAKDTNSRTEFEKGLTNTDSAAVVQLANVFFEYLEREDYYDAAAMLYKVDRNDVHAEPQLLDNEEMEATVQSFSVSKYYGHHIDYIKFNQHFLNEMRCSAVIFPAQDGLPEATMTFYFKPVEYLGSWVLCLMNSDSGDQTIVRERDKDSLTAAFHNEEQAPR